MAENGEDHTFNTREIEIQHIPRQVQRYIDKARKWKNATQGKLGGHDIIKKVLTLRYKVSAVKLTPSILQIANNIPTGQRVPQKWTEGEITYIKRATVARNVKVIAQLP